MERTMRVLARPGTPTRRQWARVKTAARTWSMTSVWPTMMRLSWFIIWPRVWLNWARYSAMRSVDTGTVPRRGTGGGGHCKGRGGGKAKELTAGAGDGQHRRLPCLKEFGFTNRGGKP